MKAAVMRATGAPLVIERVRIDDPGPGEVLVRTAASGICHSDLHVIEGGLPVPPPTILGHEPAGVVEAVGPGVVVASAMGQEKHPDWRYNVEANPEVTVQTRGKRFAARARVLSHTEKTAVWPMIRRAIPQMTVYEGRTKRNIRVSRLQRLP